MMSEEPQADRQRYARYHDYQTLVIDEHAEDLYLAVNKWFQDVVRPNEAFETANALQAQALQYDEADSERGNDFGGRHPSQSDEHELVDGQPEERGDGQRNDYGKP